MDVKDIPASKEVVDHILEHHGVLGMKWGVHRSSRSSGESGGGSGKSEVTVKTGHSPRGHAVIKTSGGKKVPAHPDAVAAKKVEQQLKSSGHHSLSNEQLQRYATRKELESRVNRVAPQSDYQKMIKGARKVPAFLRSPEGQATTAMVKKAAGSKFVRKKLATGLTMAALAA